MKPLLDRLRLLNAHASRAPWHIGHVNEVDDSAEIENKHSLYVGHIHWRRDQTFICEMRNMMPRLLDALQAVDAILARSCPCLPGEGPCDYERVRNLLRDLGDY